MDDSIIVNGKKRPRVALIADLVRELGLEPERPGLAIAVNGEIVPRGVWSRHELNRGDRIELVGATQGG